MKKLYKNQKYSLYYIQKELNLDIKRLYRYADGSVPVDKIPFNLICDIAKVEGIEPMELFSEMKEYLGGK